MNLKHFEDESVHSWIFRNLIVEGEIDFSTILTSDGYWYNNATFLKKCPERMEGIDDVELIRFLRCSGMAHKSAGFYDNPVDYLDKVENIFYPSLKRVPKSSSYGPIPIRFCPDCISRSIKEYGCAYFKWEWLDGVNCSVHNTLLKQLSRSKRKNIVSTISKVLAAHELEPTMICSLSLEYTKVRISSYSSAQLPFHIMPCFLSNFHFWATRWREDHSLGTDFYNWYYKNRRRKPISRECLQWVFEKYMEEFPKKSKQYISEYGEVTCVKFGINGPGLLSEKLLKSRKYNCSYCTKWTSFGECPARPIMVVGLDSRLQTNLENPCDFFLQHGFPYYPRRLVDLEPKTIDSIFESIMGLDRSSGRVLPKVNTL
ncbi:hypothetical protein [Vibrio hibernica]|uniref:hypothetical protein n=1 Tax=Vibrio hibernica TaxID=2587465 RepID=UPI00187F7BAC|nr:hypothetical protein [Vibrio hibernica]